MRNPKQNEMIVSTIYLGLLATRLQLFLTSTQPSGDSWRYTGTIDRWIKIMDETIGFLRSPQKQGISSKTDNRPSPRFLARAPYLEPLCDAVPNANKKGITALTAYLKDIYKIFLKLQEQKMLDSQERSKLLTFTNSIATICVDESTKFKQEPHPEWPSKPALATT